MRRIRKLTLSVLILLLICAGAGLIYIRTAPSDVALYHVDPVTTDGTGRPNEYRTGPGLPEEAAFDADPATVAAAFEAVALAAPRTILLAGGAQEGWATYVQRSRLIGWPDYISVKAVDLGEGRSALAIWSRSRFGYSDWGVNQARVERWLEKTRAALG